MVARVIYSDSAFVGSNVSALPQLPAFIPVQGYTRRWFAQHFDQFLDGTPIAEWPDAVANSKVTAAGSKIAGATSPVLASRGKNRVVRFNGSTDALGISDTPVTAEPFTVSMVFYAPTTPMVNAFLYATNETLLKGLMTNSEGVVQMRASGQAESSAAMGTGWHIVTAVANGASTKVRVDDNVTFTFTASSAAPRNTTTFGRSGWGGGAANYELAEAVEWSSALTDSQISQVHSTFKARYLS